MEVKNYFAFTAENKPIPFCTAYLYEAGTSNLVSGLTDKNGNPIDNPFQADKDGLVQFAVANGIYDLRFESGLRDYRIRVSALDPTGINDVLAGTIKTIKAPSEFPTDTSTLEDGKAYDVINATDDSEGGGGHFVFDKFSAEPEFSGMTHAPAIGSGRFKRNSKDTLQASWFGIKCHETFDNGPRFQAMFDYMAYSKRLEAILPGGESNIVVATPATVPTIVNSSVSSRGLGIRLKGEGPFATRIRGAVSMGHALKGLGNDFGCLENLMGFSNAIDTDEFGNPLGGHVFEFTEGYQASILNVNGAGIPGGYFLIDNSGASSGGLGNFALTCINMRYGSLNGAAEFQARGGMLRHGGTHGLIMLAPYINAARSDGFQTGHASKETDSRYNNLDSGGYAADINGWRKPLGIVHVKNGGEISIYHPTLETRPTSGICHSQFGFVFEGFCRNVNLWNLHGENTATAAIATISGSTDFLTLWGGQQWSKDTNGFFNPNYMLCYNDSSNTRFYAVGTEVKSDSAAAHDPSSGGYHYNDEGYFIKGLNQYYEEMWQKPRKQNSGSQAARRYASVPVTKVYSENSFANNSGNTVEFPDIQLVTAGKYSLNFRVNRVTGITDPQYLRSSYELDYTPDYEAVTTVIPDTPVSGSTAQISIRKSGITEFSASYVVQPGDDSEDVVNALVSQLAASGLTLTKIGAGESATFSIEGANFGDYFALISSENVTFSNLPNPATFLNQVGADQSAGDGSTKPTSVSFTLSDDGRLSTIVTLSGSPATGQYAASFQFNIEQTISDL